MYCKHCGKKIRNTAIFCKHCGKSVLLSSIAGKKRKTKILIIFLVIVGVVLINFVILFAVAILTSNNNKIQMSKVTQEEIAESVVNIYCFSADSSIESSGGSGTIMTEDGMILTNSHIVPQDKENIFVDERGCLVILPDPITGQPKEMYWAHPYVLGEISDKYDLAYMSIYAAYYDEETKEYAGIYPKKFKTFDDTTRCENENIQLGEPVRILGYPAISGGYSLTITDGVVSSIPGDGTIVTSAKISHGNSGGLAVDRNGCMLGVPTVVNSDEFESLGIIYSMSIVRAFNDEISKLSNQ